MTYRPRYAGGRTYTGRTPTRTPKLGPNAGPLLAALEHGAQTLADLAPTLGRTRQAVAATAYRLTVTGHTERLPNPTRYRLTLTGRAAL